MALVKCIRNPLEHLADRLHGSMDRIGTDDTTLIRIVAARSEVDLGDIKEVFLNKYGKSLADFIQVILIGSLKSSVLKVVYFQDDTSGDYKNSLLAIVG